MPIEQTQAQKARDAQLLYFLGQARNQYGAPQQFPDFSTVASQSPYTLRYLQGLDQLSRGEQGQLNPLQQQAADTLSSTARGDYLDIFNNPATQGLVDRITGDVGRSVNSRFAAANRLGSQANSEALGRGINDALAPVLFQQFAQERENQLNAARQLPAISQLGALNLGYLGQAGQQQDAYSQALKQDQLDRFNFQQNEPIRRLERFGGQLGVQPSGLYEGAQSNPFLQYAGLGISGLGALAQAQQSGLFSSGGLFNQASDFVGGLFG